MLQTHADGRNGDSTDADVLLGVRVLVNTELFPGDVELIRLLLPWSLLMSSSALRPTLVGLHPTEVHTHVQYGKTLLI